MDSSSTPRVAYVTILASNYLPKALALAESLKRQHGATLNILLIDVADASQLPEVSVGRVHSTEFLDLPLSEVHRLATIYQLVEFATAVKPRALRVLLENHDEVYYLDPDLYLVSPMDELSGELAASEGGLLLTPHFLRPPGEDSPLREAHLLTVGIFNLGFCGVDHRAVAFLDWWWEKLRSQCLFDLLSGLFVDQKWVDIGAELFRGRALRHPGYNLGVGNLHERPLHVVGGELVVETTGEPVRLFHFHAFDADRPSELSTRFRWSTAEMRRASTPLDALCVEYADKIHGYASGSEDAGYVYDHDSQGRYLRRLLRRAYRLDWDKYGSLPSPFVRSDEDAWSEWRRSAWRKVARSLVGDAAKSFRVVLPEEAGEIAKRVPRLRARIRSDFVDDTGMWG